MNNWIYANCVGHQYGPSMVQSSDVQRDQHNAPTGLAHHTATPYHYHYQLGGNGWQQLMPANPSIQIAGMSAPQINECGSNIELGIKQGNRQQPKIPNPYYYQWYPNGWQQQMLTIPPVQQGCMSAPQIDECGNSELGIDLCNRQQQQIPDEVRNPLRAAQKKFVLPVSKKCLKSDKFYERCHEQRMKNYRSMKAETSDKNFGMTKR